MILERGIDTRLFKLIVLWSVSGFGASSSNDMMVIPNTALPVLLPNLPTLLWDLYHGTTLAMWLFDIESRMRIEALAQTGFWEVLGAALFISQETSTPYQEALVLYF
jgi:hypothetical protein